MSIIKHATPDNALTRLLSDKATQADINMWKTCLLARKPKEPDDYDNTVFKEHLWPLMDWFDTPEDYNELQLYAHAGLITYNADFGGKVYKVVNCHYKDKNSAYLACCKGIMPTGKMYDGQGLLESDINLIELKYKSVILKKQYRGKSMPRWAVRHVKIKPHAVKFKWYITNADEIETSYQFNDVDKHQNTYYMLEAEYNWYRQYYDFVEPIVTYTHHFATVEGKYDQMAETLYKLKCEGGVSKLGIVKMFGMAIQHPKYTPVVKTVEYKHHTQSIISIWIWWKCRLEMLNETVKLALAGNTMLFTCTDCIAWMGNTPAELTAGLGGWGGLGVGKSLCNFDSFYMAGACQYVLELAGKKIKVTHGNSLLSNSIQMLDRVPINWLHIIIPEMETIVKKINEGVKV